MAKYKRKLLALLTLCGMLLAAYILTLVFDPENRAGRKALWTALEPKEVNDARKIELYDDEKVVLTRDGNLWFVDFEDALYPALQEKVSGMLVTLSTRGPYPVRSRSEAAREKLLLTEETARRITVSDAGGVPLMDILVGAPDATGKNVYMREEGSGEIRSGGDVFSAFLTGRQSWLDLRLFPGSDGNGVAVSSIQRVIAQPPEETSSGAEDGENGAAVSYILARNNGGWLLENSGEEADTQAVEAYIRRILNCKAGDFTSAMGANDPPFTNSSPTAGRIILETGEGTRLIITIGPRFMDSRSAAVSGSPYVYLLADWQFEQLFEQTDSFIKK
jgi:hypothetical protein